MVDKTQVCVVGADGFVGSWLRRTLARRGMRVAELNRKTPMLESSDRPVPALRTAHTIFYLAMSVNISLAEESPRLVAADRSTFAKFLDAMAETPERPTVVLTSTGGAIYDMEAEPPHSESSQVLPLSAYGRAKLEMERQLLAHRGVVRPIVLRLSNVYGPGQRTDRSQGVVGHWLDAARRGVPLRVYGSLRSVRDYIYVQDAVDAMICAHCRAAELESGWPDPIFNIGSGAATSLADLLDAATRAVDRRVVAIHEPGRPFDDRRSWLDITRAEKALDWRPRTRLNDGVARTWHWTDRPGDDDHGRS
ncbi:MAG TPA: NAD-dependent epimerase/dehydratase family protein [Rugosimonospora sp.]|nr:NAD-dependent epimerase/dehydratase family protein [Rugosimonospora sp.]